MKAKTQKPCLCYHRFVLKYYSKLEQRKPVYEVYIFNGSFGLCLRICILISVDASQKGVPYANDDFKVTTVSSRSSVLISSIFYLTTLFSRLSSSLEDMTEFTNILMSFRCIILCSLRVLGELMPKSLMTYNCFQLCVLFHQKQPRFDPFC